jgi:hypothetical protein
MVPVIRTLPEKLGGVVDIPRRPRYARLCRTAQSALMMIDRTIDVFRVTCVLTPRHAAGHWNRESDDAVGF